MKGGIDATTLEANAAMRSMVRRDTGEGYEDFLKGLARESGIKTPTREDLARLDRTRKNKASNRDWVNRHDPDARIRKPPVGMLEKVKLRGIDNLAWLFTFTGAAYNLCRLRNLMVEA